MKKEDFENQIELINAELKKLEDRYDKKCLIDNEYEYTKEAQELKNRIELLSTKRFQLFVKKQIAA